MELLFCIWPSENGTISNSTCSLYSLQFTILALVPKYVQVQLKKILSLVPKYLLEQLKILALIPKYLLVQLKILALVSRYLLL